MLNLLYYISNVDVIKDAVRHKLSHFQYSVGIIYCLHSILDNFMISGMAVHVYQIISSFNKSNDKFIYIKLMWRGY